MCCPRTSTPFQIPFLTHWHMFSVEITFTSGRCPEDSPYMMLCVCIALMWVLCDQEVCTEKWIEKYLGSCRRRQADMSFVKLIEVDCCQMGMVETAWPNKWRETVRLPTSFTMPLMISRKSPWPFCLIRVLGHPLCVAGTGGGTLHTVTDELVMGKTIGC